MKTHVVMFRGGLPKDRLTADYTTFIDAKESGPAPQPGPA
jgi:hypothetical protein